MSFNFYNKGMSAQTRNRRLRRETLEISQLGISYSLDSDWNSLEFHQQNHLIRMVLPEMYPFKPPQYLVWAQKDPNPSLTRGISRQFNLPSGVEEVIQQYLTPNRWIDLKKYLYQRYLYHYNHQPPPYRQHYQTLLSQFIEHYNQNLGPDQWSPACKIVNHLPCLQDYLSKANGP